MQTILDLEQKYNRARGNLLLVVVLSLINVILVLTNAGISFLFSATFPMFAVAFGQEIAMGAENNIYLILGGVAAVLVIAVYFICYLLSKKYKVFILVSLILFCIDTLFLAWFLTLGIDFSAIIDIAFHGWVIFSLAVGAKASIDINKFPPHEENVEENNEQNNTINSEVPMG